MKKKCIHKMQPATAFWMAFEHSAEYDELLLDSTRPCRRGAGPVHARRPDHALVT